MLMTESLRIGEMLRTAMAERFGEAGLGTRFRAFDTICSATQERQDAVLSLLDEHPLDLALVVGGYNSSNTCNLARICADRIPTYHIGDPDCLLSAEEVRHRPVGASSTQRVEEVISGNWLPAGYVRVGLTAGASTPNSIIGEVIERVERLAAG
jgi:4-hydroxy-3-methylbut-2-enyl diphosphate reductase